MSSRVALVTAAAAGLARGIAATLASDGYRIAFTYRPGGTPPDETLRRVRAHDADALAIASDGDRLDDAARVVGQVERARGPVEVFVHALGPIVVRRFATGGFADYRPMVDGNLGSAAAYAEAVLPSMRARGFGRLVFFGMNGSHVTLPARGMALYGAAKAGVVQFARTLALEEGRAGITVNVVEPGDIRDKDAGRAAAAAIAATNPTGHAGSWEDIADAVRFLVRDDAGFVNGAVLGVNGGLAEPYEP